VDVHTMGRSLRLKEVIADADPPHRLSYRVVDVPMIRSHRGEIRLSKTALGTDLSWHVEYELALRPMEIGAKLVLETELKKSLLKLAGLAHAVDADLCTGRSADNPPPQNPPFEDPADDALWRAAEAISKAQRAVADHLEASGDPKRWFARVYQYVTENQIAWARSGNVRHVGWVLRLIPRFHEYYAVNLERRLHDRPGLPELHWQSAFDDMEGRFEKPDPRLMLFIGLLRGMKAHIEEDLPRALAGVWLESYRGRCDYARFRADYMSMGGIFGRATEQLMAHVPPAFLPWYFRGPGAWMPNVIKDRIRRKRYYDLPRARFLAFERGARLAGMLQSVACKQPFEVSA
jgi:hypothetical protein